MPGARHTAQLSPPLCRTDPTDRIGRFSRLPCSKARVCLVDYKHVFYTRRGQTPNRAAWQS